MQLYCMIIDVSFLRLNYLTVHFFKIEYTSCAVKYIVKGFCMTPAYWADTGNRKGIFNRLQLKF